MKLEATSEIIFNLVKHYLWNAPDSQVRELTVKVQKGEPAGKVLNDAGLDPSAVSGSRKDFLSEDPDKTENQG